jgi:biopolymer transport protein ExbB
MEQSMAGKIVDGMGIFFWIFILISLIGVTLVIWRFVSNLFAKTDLDELLQQIDQKIESGGPQEVYDYCKAQGEEGMVARLFPVALEAGQRGRVAARNAMTDVIELDIMPQLNFLLSPMLLLAKIAPMIGLLGTVVGMILSFDKLATDPNNTQAVASDIGMALFTTAAGLIIAIPMLIAYSYFRQRLQRFEVEIQRGVAAALELLPKVFQQPTN